MIPPVDLPPIITEAIATRVIGAGKATVIVGRLAGESAGVPHWADHGAILLSDENRRVHHWKDAGILVVWLSTAKVGKAFQERLELVRRDARFFPRLLRLPLLKGLLSFDQTATLREDVLLPLRLLFLQVLCDVTGSALLGIGGGMLKVALQVTRHLEVFTLRAAHVDILERFPVHLGGIAPAQVVKILANSGGIAHILILGSRSRDKAGTRRKPLATRSKLPGTNAVIAGRST